MWIILYTGTCTCITLVSVFFSAESRNRMFTAVVEMLRWFAGHQIRNVAVSACRFKCIIFFYVYDIYYYINLVSFKICTLYSIYQPKLGRKFWRKKNTKKCQILSQLSYFCVYNVKRVKDEFQVLGCYFLGRSHSKQQKYQYLENYLIFSYELTVSLLNVKRNGYL